MVSSPQPRPVCGASEPGSATNAGRGEHVPRPPVHRSQWRGAGGGRLDMRTQWLVAVTVLVSLGPWTQAAAQGVGQLYDSVSASVVVIKARGREASDTGGGLLNFGETGSGVLIADGKVKIGR